jgi:hypothetical protein
MFERYRDAGYLLDCPRKKRGPNDTPKACCSEEVGVQCAVCPKKRGITAIPILLWQVNNAGLRVA